MTPPEELYSLLVADGRDVLGRPLLIALPHIVEWDEDENSPPVDAKLDDDEFVKPVVVAEGKMIVG